MNVWDVVIAVGLILIAGLSVSLVMQLADEFQAPSQKEFVRVGVWSQQNVNQTRDYAMDTELFTVTGDLWQIRWSWSYITPGSHFVFIVLDDVGHLVTEFKTLGNVTDRSTSLDVKGTFRLSIFVVGTLMNWRAEVWDFK